jgi:hypothetical protein
MAGFNPITLRAVDNTNKQLFEYSVPFTSEITALQVMEQAFVLAQTHTTSDPFLFTLEYYGYSQSVPYPGYLGYEVESIAGLPSNSQFYWELLVNGVASSSGANTTYPNPGSTVTWQYTAIPSAPANLSRRAELVQKRHAGRA